MVGGLHYQKVDGDSRCKAPIIALIGAVGDFKGGGSSLKLGGGPVVIDGIEDRDRGARCGQAGRVVEARIVRAA